MNKVYIGIPVLCSTKTILELNLFMDSYFKLIDELDTTNLEFKLLINFNSIREVPDNTKGILKYLLSTERFKDVDIIYSNITEDFNLIDDSLTYPINKYIRYPIFEYISNLKNIDNTYLLSMDTDEIICNPTKFIGLINTCIDYFNNHSGLNIIRFSTSSSTKWNTKDDLLWSGNGIFTRAMRTNISFSPEESESGLLLDDLMIFNNYLKISDKYLVIETKDIIFHYYDKINNITKDQLSETDYRHPKNYSMINKLLNEYGLPSTNEVLTIPEIYELSKRILTKYVKDY